MAIYRFKVKTGDQFLAGTDSNIFIKLYGPKGISEEKRLNGYISGNAFERNETNSFNIDFGMQDFGDIYKIDVRSDCMYGGSDWLCSSFEIQKLGSPNTSTFNYDRWISNQNINPLLVTSGYVADVPEAKIKYIEVLGAKHHVPSNVEVQIVCSTSVDVTVDYRKTQVIENATKASVEVAAGAVKATVDNILKFGIEKQMGVKLEYIEKTEVITKVPASDKARNFQEIWSEENYYFEASIGEQSYSFNIPKKKVWSGFKELD